MSFFSSHDIPVLSVAEHLTFFGLGTSQGSAQRRVVPECSRGLLLTYAKPTGNIHTSHFFEFCGGWAGAGHM